MSEIRTRRRRTPLLLAMMGLAAACGDDPVAPEPEVIEETDFAASLGIDLNRMTVTGAGVYVEDLVLGTGDPAAVGDDLDVSFTGWLSNGTMFDSGLLGFVLGRGDVIQGFDEGVEGMRLGGRRKIIMPPGVAYGDIPPAGIPPGAILIFDIQLLAIDSP